jgi:hypothetical protein
MIDKLPHTLTAGVTATQEGLEIADMVTAGYFGVRHSAYGGYLIPWHDAAERLRYREGEPFCRTEHGIIECWSGESNLDDTMLLQRLAAILCDDAEAFRALHWCIENLGGEEKNQ